MKVHWNFTFLYIITFSSSIGASEVYQCEVDGVTTYSQIPCGVNEEKLTVESANVVGGRPKEQLNTHSNQVKSDNTQSFILKRKIRRHEAKISMYTNKMKKEVELLKVRTTYANNNLAGAIYQDALSQEMIAVTNKYNSLINREKGIISRLKEQLTDESQDN
ncbi:hypothetical protein [Thalassotalea ganghwensis]